MKEGKLFVISGPGGAGKTTIVKELFREKNIKDAFIKGIAVTTRIKRPGEKNGKDYFFVSKDDFLKLKKKKFFLESQKVLKNYYGTPNFFYTLAKKQRKGLILCIDVKGGMCLKKRYKADKIVTLFIDAPTEKELFRRMEKREEVKDIMRKRVKLAKKESRFSKEYDYLIVNRDIKKSLEKIEEILLTKN